MKIRKFQIDRDLEHLETYLRDQYIINKNTTSWLPERLHDLIYRISAHEADQGLKGPWIIFSSVKKMKRL